MTPEPNSIYRKPNCPYGKKAVELLKKKNISFHDELLQTEEEIQEIKNQYHVHTTPQIFIDGERIGGYDDLAEKFGE